MKFLLDSNVLSDVVKGHVVLPRFKQTNPSVLGISCITAMEIEIGLQINPDLDRKLAPRHGCVAGKLS